MPKKKGKEAEESSSSIANMEEALKYRERKWPRWNPSKEDFFNFSQRVIDVAKANGYEDVFNGKLLLLLLS